jgi:hypothetical protein
MSIRKRDDSTSSMPEMERAWLKLVTTESFGHLGLNIEVLVNF